jgi:hypothetical protein
MRLFVCLCLAAVIYLPNLHRCFDHAPDVDELHTRRRLTWEDARTLRATNPEWELMARMFTVLAFGDRTRRSDDEMNVADAIIDRTIADVEAHGVTHFLLPYGRDATRSLFVDGELALMLAANGRDARPWVDRARAQIEAGPAMLGESYPDEAWMFCNAVALAAIALHDRNQGEPDRHAALFARWVANARARFVDRETWLLASKIGYRGDVREGPEGSTIWLVAAMLRHIDEPFARDQYARAKAELRGSFLGFGWAREWPASAPGHDDVDSGPTIPIVGANAGSSGLALVAAHAFGDDTFASELETSLAFAGFPEHEQRDDGCHGLRYAAGNDLADAVILYAERMR